MTVSNIGIANILSDPLVLQQFRLLVIFFLLTPNCTLGSDGQVRLNKSTRSLSAAAPCLLRNLL